MSYHQPMKRLVLLAAVGVLALGLGVDGFAQRADLAGLTVHRAGINVRVVVRTGLPGSRRVRSFTLTCNPVGGTLPLAQRICLDIKLHTKAMLEPPKSGRPPRETILCSGGPSMPLLSVRATRHGTTRTFSGSPGCDWPGSQSLAVYFAAASNDTSSLPMSELELRCDEDPILLAVPTPLASVVACRHGLWTAHAEKLIRIAASAPKLVPFQAATQFPHDVGALPCIIHAGGAYPGRKLPGLCGVTIHNPWADVTVSFTEDWPLAVGKTARHIWHVVIKSNHVIATTETGAAPPQTWP
jgi:hypothetical protein